LYFRDYDSKKLIFCQLSEQNRAGQASARVSQMLKLSGVGGDRQLGAGKDKFRSLNLDFFLIA